MPSSVAKRDKHKKRALQNAAQRDQSEIQSVAADLGTPLGSANTATPGIKIGTASTSPYGTVPLLMIGQDLSYQSHFQGQVLGVRVFVNGTQVIGSTATSAGLTDNFGITWTLKDGASPSTVQAAQSANDTVVMGTNGSIVDASGNVWTINTSEQVVLNGTAVTITSNVVELAYVNGVVWQKNNSNYWYATTGTNPVSYGTGTLASPLPVAGTGNFQIKNGQMYDPAGRVFYGKGINVYDSAMGEVSQNASNTPLTTLFPGINIVRVPCYSYQAPSAYTTFIDHMTAAGIVVVLENHQNFDANGVSPNYDAGGGQGIIFTNANGFLQPESAWYAANAAAYANNPYVWFGTNNEPSDIDGNGNDDLAALSTWQQATYNAIRGTGATNIIAMELWGGGITSSLGLYGGMTASVYAAMTGVIWDYHQYAWLYGDSPDSGGYTQDAAVMASNMANNMATVQTMTSGDGVMPIWVGEYGISTDGSTVDQGGTQLCEAVQACPAIFASCAWNWNSGAASDNLTDGNGNLTSYGQQVAGFIGTTPAALPVMLASSSSSREAAAR